MSPNLPTLRTVTSPYIWPVMQLLIVAILLAVVSVARAQTSCQTSLNQTGTPNQSGTFCLIPITTATTPPTGTFTYVPLAMNDSGEVFYYQTSSAAPLDFFDIYTGNGSTVPSLVYLSPAYNSSSTTPGVNGTSGFLGVNNSGQVTLRILRPVSRLEIPSFRRAPPLGDFVSRTRL